MRNLVAFGLLQIVLVAAVGCEGVENGDEDGALMKPGEDCMRCHDGSGEAPRLGIAGTVFSCADAATGAGLGGVTVVLTNESGDEIKHLTSNAAGNFYTSMALPAGTRVRVEQNGAILEMGAAPSSGACNSCHTVPAQGYAPGRLYIGQEACGATPILDALQDVRTDSGVP